MAVPARIPPQAGHCSTPFLAPYYGRFDCIRGCLRKDSIPSTRIFSVPGCKLTKKKPPQEFCTLLIQADAQVFHPYLIKMFENVPGTYYLAQRRYHLLNARTGEIINPRIWKTMVKPGFRISMAIVMVSLPNAPRSCPCCSGVKNRDGSDKFAT